MSVALAARLPDRCWRLGVIGVLLVLLLAATVLALLSGAAQLTPQQAFAAVRAVVQGEALSDIRAEDPALAIVSVIRLPRILLTMLVGAALAVSGAAMQGLFRNPLADPGLIGVSSGAALGAVSVIVLGTQWPWLSASVGLPLAAALGGLLATGIVYRLSREAARSDVATLLLAGIAINAIAAAGTGLLTYFADDGQLRTLTFWLLGGLGGAHWAQLGVVAPFLLLCTVGLCFLGRPLNAFLLGEDVAHHLGYSVEVIKAVAIVLSAVAVGAAVAVSGVIGFVGLVVPHLLRLAIGADHRLLLPATALLGAAGLLLADTVARTLVSPAELPIGILTALLGGPFFLALLQRRKKWLA